MEQTLIPRNAELALAGPVGTLESYIQLANSIPVLSREQERELAVRYREHQDLDAARQLVLSSLRFVVHIARGYRGYGLPMGDLVQEGNIGLMKAVKRFDPSIGVRLVSFAVHWIRAEIHEFVLRNWRVVKVATTKAQRKLFFNLRKAKSDLGWLSADETEAVAQDLGVSAAEVSEMEQRLSARDAPFDRGSDDQDDSGLPPAGYLPAPEADPAMAVELDDWSEQSSRRLAHALGKLDDRSREILESRWLSEDKTTLHELATRYGVSAERIRQVEGTAIKKLRGMMI